MDFRGGHVYVFDSNYFQINYMTTNWLKINFIFIETFIFMASVKTLMAERSLLYCSGQ